MKGLAVMTVRDQLRSIPKSVITASDTVIGLLVARRLSIGMDINYFIHDRRPIVFTLPASHVLIELED